MCHHIPQATYPNPVRVAPMDSYLVLLRVGFTVPQTVTSCAVRSYRTLSPLPAPVCFRTWRLGGLLSVALSVGSRLPGVTWHSALWSPDFPPRRTLSASGRYARSDCLADSGRHITLRYPPVQGQNYL